MALPIIHVENVSKMFLISHEENERYTALRDVITSRTKRLLKGNVRQETKEEFWALRDINFSIYPGERVGIIGRNGAGKSTLLKILSRITAPSNGRITMRGRVASLLEVGTGFHPELTGRENIFLNGAILGMSRVEIRKKFSDIVEFAEVDKFLDTPVKRYSSGMYVRLAFAIAAHLEPEILIIDEVLAVGDVQFQKKCLGKMEDVSKNEGRTILFVSHNMGVLSSFCENGILLDKGQLVKSDSVKNIIPFYYNMMKKSTNEQVQVEVLPFSYGDSWTVGNTISLRVSWDSSLFPFGCICDLAFYTIEGTKVFALQSDKMSADNLIPMGKDSVVFEIENIGLVDRELRVDVGLKSGLHENYKVLVDNACSISIPSEKLFDHKVSDAIIVPPARLYF